jgi:gluconate 2-dehydrogenase gamma chain
VRFVKRVSRRALLSAGALVTSSKILDASARTISGEMPWAPGEANAPSQPTPGLLQFFSEQEAAFIDAATSRLIPTDDLGPGAKEANVLFFLDRQLAGPYGRADRWYMRGPWPKGSKSQGFQSRQSPAQIYRTAIKEIDDHCRSTGQKKSFVELSADEQDKVLKDLEGGKIKLPSTSSDSFFTMFLQNTIEGFFSDPIHGGNRDMVGWKLIGFPGARYDYRPYVAKHNQKVDLEPVSIAGRKGWNAG